MSGRALMNELARALANARRADTAVHVAFVDLDGFKAFIDQAFQTPLPAIE